MLMYLFFLQFNKRGALTLFLVYENVKEPVRVCVSSRW